MVFKANIPQGTDFISQSQRDMIGNFESVDDIWGKRQDANVGDHVPLTNAKIDDFGKHKKTTLVEQALAPGTGANEVAYYSKAVNSSSEIFYEEQSAAAEIQLTSNRKLIQGGIVLEAFVMFDFNGNIIENEREDENGNVLKVPLSFNITDITKNDGSDWVINFTTPITTEDYIWVTQSMNRSNQLGNIRVGNAQPNNNAIYSNVVNSNSFNFIVGNVPANNQSVNNVVSINKGLIMIFQAYTVI